MRSAMFYVHIAANFGIEIEDFDNAPFAQKSGLGKVNQLLLMSE